MRTDGLFTIHQVELKNWPSGKTLKIVPFGDVHHDSPAHARDKWQKFLARAKSFRDVLFLGMGDYTDSFSTSERMVVYSHLRHDSTAQRQEEEERGRIQRLASELAFMRGRLIGLLGGNHFMQFANGETGDMLLAKHLGTRYLGVCSAIRITFKRNRKTSGHSLDIFAHHGRGAGMTAGGRYNSVEKLLNVCDCDIAIMGDNHACGAFRAGERLYMAHSGDGLTLKSKSRWVGRTGSFLRGYVPGQRSYVVDGAMMPANLGWIEFDVTPIRRTAGGRDVTDIEITSTQ